MYCKYCGEHTTHKETVISSYPIQSKSAPEKCTLNDMKLEVDIIPVSDVERSKQFYQRLGWRLDDDVAPPKGKIVR